MLTLLISILLFGGCQQTPDMQEKRYTMVEEQLVRRGIRNDDVLRAMRKVERHKFVPVTQRDGAYDDRPLPIGEGQTISQPFIVAHMTALLNPGPGDRVLEIGTGSGYQAAVLAEIVDHVYTIEILEPLGRRAQETLASLGYDNVTVKIGDGYAGWEEHAPYDGIVVTAAPEEIPEPLIEQLAEGGRMIIPVGRTNEVQTMTIVEKSGGEIKKISDIQVRFVPFTRDTLPE